MRKERTELSMIAGMLRACDGCVECCIQIAVPLVGSKVHDPCKYLSPTANGGKPGCGWYRGRPLDCHGFVCMWKVGEAVEHFLFSAPGTDYINAKKRGIVFPAMPESLKPDKCGMVCQPEGETEMTMALCCYERIAGLAARNQEMMRYLTKVNYLGLNVVIIPPKREDRVFIPGRGREHYYREVTDQNGVPYTIGRLVAQ